MESYDDLFQINYMYSLVAASSFTFFTVMFYIVSPWFSKKISSQYETLDLYVQHDWNSRVIAVIHASVVTPLAIYVVLVDEEAKRDPVWGNSLVARTAMALTEGYMISDFIIVLRYFPLKDAVIYSFHHIATLYPYTYNVLYGPMPYFGCFKLATEGSTPFVNIRWFLSTLKRSDSDLYYYNGIVMTGLFFMLRVVPIIPFWIAIYGTFTTHPMQGITWEMRGSLVIGSLILDLLNLYWFRKMLHGAKKVMNRRSLVKEEMKNKGL